ncbi:MAG: carbohydrate ABC transporter permease [Eubacteriales bacterium]|nr:carbohydrate ABC transporter permease [Eubacteriales bacterium]
MIGKSKGIHIAANVVLSILTICVIVPFLILISSSMTSEHTLIREGYGLLPKDIDFTAYNLLLGGSSSILQGYLISFGVTLMGTVVSLTITTLFAYPLSRKELPARNFLAFFLFFTMLFNGGLVSSYMMWTRTFHIKDTVWALLVPNLLMSGFNVIMMRTYFTSNIPEEVIDAAKIDGAGELKLLVSVVLPMSLPILATVGLLIGLGYWNDWLNGLYYVNDDRLYNIQVILNKMLLNAEAMKKAAGAGVVGMPVPSTSMKMAVAVLGALPVMVLYPFFQKYFVKGITVGAVKG